MVLPAASTTSAPAGIPVVSRGPAATMRSSRMMITESAIGSPPVPSMSCAPTMAKPAGSGGGAEVPAQAASVATATKTRTRCRLFSHRRASYHARGFDPQAPACRRAPPRGPWLGINPPGSAKLHNYYKGHGRGLIGFAPLDRAPVPGPITEELPCPQGRSISQAPTGSVGAPPSRSPSFTRWRSPPCSSPPGTRCSSPCWLHWMCVGVGHRAGLPPAPHAPFVQDAEAAGVFLRGLRDADAAGRADLLDGAAPHPPPALRPGRRPAHAARRQVVVAHAVDHLRRGAAR